jgi:hypothetical protein
VTFGVRGFRRLTSACVRFGRRHQRRLLGPLPAGSVRLRSGGRRSATDGDPRARNRLGCWGLSARSGSCGGDAQGRLPPSLGQSAGWGGRPEPAPPKALGARGERGAPRSAPGTTSAGSAASRVVGRGPPPLSPLASLCGARPGQHFLSASQLGSWVRAQDLVYRPAHKAKKS